VYTGVSPAIKWGEGSMRKNELQRQIAFQAFLELISYYGKIAGYKVNIQ